MCTLSFLINVVNPEDQEDLLKNVMGFAGFDSTKVRQYVITTV